MSVSYLRMAGWLSPTDLTMPVCVIGVGALGSHVALCAAKMGFSKFIIFDHDCVEEHNLPNQAYDLPMVGMLKVDALEEVLTRFNPMIEVVKYPRQFVVEDVSLLQGYVVSALDSMEGRRILIDAIDSHPNVLLFLEARLGFDHAMTNVVMPFDRTAVSSFRKGLRPDSEVEDGPCNLRVCNTLVTIVSGALTHRMCEHAKARAALTPWHAKQYVRKTLYNLNGCLETANP